MRIKALTAALVLGLAACGGGDTDEPPPSSAPSAQPPAASSGVLTVPFWMQVDNSAQTVAIRLVAGETAENNLGTSSDITEGLEALPCQSVTP